jgi:ribonuclease HII
MTRFFTEPPYIEAGCDEAGRGPLAGPVVAAAVVLPREFSIIGINDSKKLNENTRISLETEIKNEAIGWAIGVCSHEEIDQFNILNASILAMHKAIDQLRIRPDIILVDGNRFKNYPFIPHQCFVKGDARFASIAAASILAKTERDRLMDNYAIQYPGYGWERNKGYPTLVHRRAIEKLGFSPIHRRTFVVKPLIQSPEC